LRKNEVIYDVGSPAEAFYILKSGKCLVETIIEIESFYRFPIDKRRWEMRKVTHKIQYKIHEVSKGGFFGHEEILQGYRRRSRVKALTNAQVYYINADDMQKHMPSER
jgi:CRP-like cAMP-binding protein